FLRTHSRHQLHELVVDPETYISEKPDYEPIGESYFLAGDEKGRFLIRREKRSLDTPAVYQVVPGELRISRSLHIREKELRTQIAREKSFSPGLKNKVDRFVQILREEVAGLSPEEFECRAPIWQPGESPCVSLAGLDDSVWARVLDRCRKDYSPAEFRTLQTFIAENRYPPDVLCVSMEKRFSVISVVGPAKVVDGNSRVEEAEASKQPASRLAARPRR
ncbi:MAG TPA: hypothetical protein VLS90_05140, partial [Thermodesulfobacteriota bacterium]|nr:hypothetical protein [Thermodesulfobacteriota bacterium]